VEEEDRDAGSEAEDRKVERESESALLSDEAQCDHRPEQLGDQELARGHEVEREDQDELAESQAVRLVPEMNLDGEGLGDEEDDHEAPPRDADRGRRWLKTRKDEQVEGKGGCRDAA